MAAKTKRERELEHEVKNLQARLAEATRRSADRPRLGENEEVLRLAYEAADLGIWEHDLRTGRIFFDERARIHVGFDSHDVPLVDTIARVHPDDVERVGREFAAKSGPGSDGSYKTEYRVIHPNGTVRWLAVQARIYFEGEGADRRAVRGVGTSQDITERRQAERECQALLEITQGVVFTADVPEFLRLVHHTIARVMDAKNFFVTLYNQDGDLFEEVYSVDKDGSSARLEKSISAYVFRTGEPLLLFRERFDELVARGEVELMDVGPISWLGVPLKTSGESIGVMAVQNYEGMYPYSERDRDFLASIAGQVALVLERKRVEEALRLSNERLSLALEAAQSGTWEWDLVTNENIWSKELWAVYGLEPGSCQPSYEAWRQTIHPDDRAGAEQAVQTAASSGTEINAEWRTVDRDGTERWLMSRGRPWRDATGRVVRYIGIALDITARKRAEEALRESETRFRTIFEQAAVGIAQLELQTGRFVKVNEKFCYIVGYSAEDLMTKNFQDITHPDDLAADMRAVTRLRAGEIPTFNREKRYVRKDGSSVWVNLTVSAMEAVGQKPRFNIAIAEDIAERKQTEAALRESLAKYRVLFESFPLGITISDKAGQIVETNRESERLLGITVVEHQHRTVDSSQWQIIRPDGSPMPPAEYAAVRALRENRLIEHVEMGIVKSPGQVTWLDVTAVPIPLEDYGVAITYSNISARKQAEADLLAERVSLARRVEERTAELSRANAELAQAARAKDEFLANMSHELRTPLNAILGLSESLQEQVYGPLNNHQLKSINTIEQSGHHLLELINDILDLAKVEADKLGLEPQMVSVVEICRSSLVFVKETATKKNLALSWHLDNWQVQIQADPRRLKQILVNLLSNAVKFTPAGGWVNLEVNSDPEAGVIHFAVQDNGIGIVAEDMARLFKPFSQLDSSLARRHEGTGLGLALVRRLADLHGGSISVESAGVPGQGSRFTVSLPWLPESTEPPAGHLEEPGLSSGGSAATVRMSSTSAGRKKTVLLVEDNETNIETIGAYLEHLGYHLIVTRNGSEALQQVGEVQPDVILMDIQLPVLDGLQVTRYLRADPRFAATPIIALTALAMPGDRERCLAAGANDYLTKPVNLKGLVQRIEGLLTR